MNQKAQTQNTSANHPHHDPMEDGVKLNGLQQVVDMLKYADPSFRESLLRRIAQRDPNLALQLKKTLR